MPLLGIGSCAVFLMTTFLSPLTDSVLHAARLLHFSASSDRLLH
jgi:hypothetical protein